MDFQNTRLSRDRPLTSYAKVQKLIAALIRNRAMHIRSRVKEKEYLDLGCGPNLNERFINLDYGWKPGTDICWDITRGIPLADASVKGVFTEHCLEHLPFRSVDFVLGEIRRVLRPGGTVRIVVPDGELYLTRYTDLLRGQTDDPLPYADEDRHEGLYSPIMSVNRIFRAHEHQFIYDFDTFRLLLEKHGFRDIVKEKYGSGRDAELVRDSEWRAVESLYVEASKGGG